MRVPQVSERIKEVPAQALRGVFAGIGQLLLITDRLRNKAPADVPRPRTPERSQPVGDATVSEPAAPQEKAAPAASAPAAPAASAPATPAASAPAAPAAPAPAAGAKPSSVKSAPAGPAAAKPTRTEAPKPPRTRDFDKTGNVRLLDDAETAAAAPAAVGSKAEDSSPPLPYYDDLSAASLRARLRNLDVSQVRRLVEYERAHAARADVIAMFERRIAKLEADA